MSRSFPSSTEPSADGRSARPTWSVYLKQQVASAVERALLRRLFPYRPLPELLARMEPRHRRACERFMATRYEAFVTAPGSQAKHQAWPGGYLAHVTETMNWAVVEYATIQALRPEVAGTFTLSTLLFTLFFHDAEKPEKYAGTAARGYRVDGPLTTKDGQKRRREQIIAEIFQELRLDPLTAEEETALRYVEGEGADYGPERKMNRLGAVAHMCDVASARLFHDHPKLDDSWRDARRYGDPR